MKVGRPNEELNRKVTIKLTEEMYSKIEYLSSRENISVSEYVRKILRKNVK